MTRLTIICISCIILNLMFAGPSYAQIDRDTILGAWLLDEGQGDTTEDASGNGNDGTLMGTPNWVAGKSGSALEFNGSSSYVNCGNAEALNVQVFSVSFWYNFPSTQDWNHMISRGQHVAWDSPGSVNWGVMMYSGEQRILFETFNDTTWAGISADTTTGQWHHVVATYDGNTMQLYHDGVLAATTSGVGILLDQSRPLLIGARSDAGSAGGFFNGSIDEVGYFNTVLALEDIEMIADYGLADIISGEALAKAGRPNPADGAIGITQPLLQWRAGNTAAFHDVYFGTNPTPGPDEFRGRQAVIQTIYYHAAGLVPGTTYYWRIDEVEADGTTIHTGDVWSFIAPALSAWNPDPPNGAKWVQSDATLSWNAGWNSIMYQVYLSPDLDAVTNGTTEADKGIVGGTSYAATGLDFDTTYYWRVDAFDDKAAWHTGDVWSFTTVGAYAGVKAQYYHHPGSTPPSPPESAFQTLVLTRVDPGINFSWGDPGSPDPSVNVDDFSARWVADLEVPVSDTYTFWTYTDDGVMLWFDGQLVIDNWTDHGNTWNSSPPLALTAGDMHSIEMWWYERGGGATAQLHWSTPTMSRQPIPPGPLSLPLKASRPNPANGAVDVKHTPTLNWSAGQEAAQHDVYFGTDPDAVANADTTTAGIYRGRQALDATNYAPTESPLQWGATYYWRIDEVNGVDVWKGAAWRFTTANCLIVDDFEEYDDFCNRLFYKWKDGWGYSADPDCGVTASGGNGTGSTVGNLAAPFAEQTIVHGGIQSMPFEYNNTGTGGKARYSEASREWATPQNWTRNDVKALTLWFHGEAGNAPETLYVALEDSTGQVRVATHPNPRALQVTSWRAWYIDLQQFSGVNLASVKKVYLGVGNRSNPTAGGSGKLYIDDIRVCPPTCIPSLAKPDADLSGDCVVDYLDVEIMANAWLGTGLLFTPQDPGSDGLVAYYPLDGDTLDASGNGHHGTAVGGPAVVAGPAGLGTALTFTPAAGDDWVECGTWDPSEGTGQLSVSIWMNWNGVSGEYMGLIGKRDAWAADDMMWHIESTQADGAVNVGREPGPFIYGYGVPEIGVWEHVAFTFDGNEVKVYRDGAEVGSGAFSFGSDPQSMIVFGCCQAGGGNPFNGALDEVRLYNRALSAEEVAWLSGRTSPFSQPYDFNVDGMVDFRDYAVLSDAWLEEILWP